MITFQTTTNALMSTDTINDIFAYLSKCFIEKIIEIATGTKTIAYFTDIAKGIETSISAAMIGFASTNPLSRANAVKIISDAVRTNKMANSDIRDERPFNSFCHSSTVDRPRPATTVY